MSFKVGAAKDAPTTQPPFVPYPEGWASFRLLDIEEGQSKAGNDMITIKYVDEEGRFLTDYILATSAWKLGAIGKACSLDWADDADSSDIVSLIRQKVAYIDIEVAHSERKDGKGVSVNVKSYLPVGEGTGTDIEFPPPEPVKATTEPAPARTKHW